MHPQLIKLREQIRRCEELVALCDRIKKLEKLQDGSLQLKKVQIETSRVEIIEQLQLATSDFQRLEADFSDCSRPRGAFEEEQLRKQIKTARIRIGTIKQNDDLAMQQIESLDAQITTSAQELDSLYTKLEEFILSGLDPNTVEAQLAELRREKDTLSQAIKSELSSAPAPGNTQQDRKHLPVHGDPVQASEFYEGLMLDFAQAQSNIDIISPRLDPQHSRPIMAELAQLVSGGRHVTIYTSPINEQDPREQAILQSLIVEAHRLRITIIQRSGLDYNAAIIDNIICWEGTVNILSSSQPHDAMRRTAAGSHVRELRRFIFRDR